MTATRKWLQETVLNENKVETTLCLRKKFPPLNCP